MAIQRQLIFGFFIMALLYTAYARPDFERNPNLEYELISGGPQVVSKPIPPPTTRKPVVINTPPPVDPNSKTFAFDPIQKTWTQIKKNSPPLPEDTLTWNQANDKYLRK